MIEAIRSETSEVVSIVEAPVAASVDELRRTARRLLDAIPASDGVRVVVEDGGSIVASLTAEQGIRESMKFVIFRDGEPVVDPVTNEAMGFEAEILGVGLVRKVNDRRSIAVIRPAEREGQILSIQPGDKIVTK